MNKRKNKIKRFFNNLWHIIEPLVNELIVYSFVILAFEIIRRFIDVYLDDKVRETVGTIKQIVLTGTLSLFAFHALISLLVVIVAQINDEIIRYWVKIKRINKNKPDLLSSKLLDFDEANEVKNLEENKIKVKSEQKN